MFFSKRRKPFIYLEIPLSAALILLVLIAGVIFFLIPNKKADSNKTLATPTKTVTPVADYHLPNGKIFGLSGVVEKVTLGVDQNDSPSTGLEQVEVQTTSNKSIKIAVNDKILINVYSDSTSSQPPKLISKEGSPKDIKKGEKIYISSLDDLTGKTSLATKDINFIDIYQPQ